MSRLARALLPVITILGSAVPLAAQDPVHPERQRVVDEVVRKRAEMREGRIDRYNVRVRVRLKNGAKMQGVVKSGRFIERAEGIEFVESERTDPDAGIRIWYFDSTSSFIFLRWAEIDTHKIIAKLTDAEVKALELEVADRERKRAEERRASGAKDQGGEPGKEAEGAGEPGKAGEPKVGKDGKPVVEQGETKDGKDVKQPVVQPVAQPVNPLLAEFPPTEGWSEQKLLDLRRRMVVVGAFPSAKEKRFMDNFADWKKAYDAQTADKGGDQPKAPGKADPASSPPK
jgi:hypothetical protein